MLDGVYVCHDDRPPRFQRVKAPRAPGWNWSPQTTRMPCLNVLSSAVSYRDGTTQVAFEPVDFMARLAALVPKPRVNLTRFHGVLAPNHRWRDLVIPAKRGAQGTSRNGVESPPPRVLDRSFT